MKATSIAPANLPFVKYMGRKDEVLRLPENASLSMNLSNLLTTTTVEFSDELEHDDILLNGEREEGEGSRGIRHLDRIRQMARINLKARVVSKTVFQREPDFRHRLPDLRHSRWLARLRRG